MNLTKIYKFRVSAVYPTRQVINNDVLYPTERQDVYTKEMPVAQALVACDTSVVEVLDGSGKWYPVSETTMKLVLDAIDAGVEPVIPENDKEIPASIVHYIEAMKVDEIIDEEYSGKYCDVSIEERTKVSGVIFHEKNKAGKLGYYLTLKIGKYDTQFENVKLLPLNGRNCGVITELEAEEKYLIFLGETVEESKSLLIEIDATNTSTDKIEKTYMSMNKLQFAGSSYYQKIPTEPDPSEPVG